MLFAPSCRPTRFQGTRDDLHRDRDRRWDLNGVLTPDQISEAVRQLAAWPLRVAQVRSLFADAWRHRHNITFADATYVVLAEHLGAPLLTGDHRLASGPTLPVPVLRLP